MALSKMAGWSRSFSPSSISIQATLPFSRAEIRAWNKNVDIESLPKNIHALSKKILFRNETCKHNFTFLSLLVQCYIKNLMICIKYPTG